MDNTKYLKFDDGSIGVSINGTEYKILTPEEWQLYLALNVGLKSEYTYYGNKSSSSNVKRSSKIKKGESKNNKASETKSKVIKESTLNEGPKSYNTKSEQKTARETNNYSFLERALLDLKFLNDIGITPGTVEGDEPGTGTYDWYTKSFVNDPNPHLALYWSDGTTVSPELLKNAYHSYLYMQLRQRFNDRGIFGNIVTNALNHAFNPILAKFREGMNDAGNLVIAAATFPGMLSGGSTIYNLYKGGKYATLLGGLGGSYLGTKAGDEVVSNLSDGKYASMYDYLTKNGFWGYNAAISNPFTIGGGYVGSKYIGAALDDLPATYLNTVNNYPRLTVLPGRGPILVQPGETIFDTPTGTVKTLPPGYYKGSVYKGRLTVKNGSGRANLYRHGFRSHTASSNLPILVTNVPESLIMTIKESTPNIPSVSNPGVIELPRDWFYVPMTGPVSTPTPPPPSVPGPQPETRYVAETIRPSAFSYWFLELWGDPSKRYTKLYYEGDNEGHAPGYYWIRRGGVGADIVSSRDVATGPEDIRGRNRWTPDSTRLSRTIYHKYYDAPLYSRKVSRPMGQVPLQATTYDIPVLSEEEMELLR